MSTKVQSPVVAGMGGALVDIECSPPNNLPNIVIVGSAAKAADKAKGRVRSAFAATSLQLPRRHITLLISQPPTCQKPTVAWTCPWLSLSRWLPIK
jgi:hypothetical protein